MDIFWSSALNLNLHTERQFKWFVQCMANRIMQGNARYGHPAHRKQYIKRALLELEAYQSTGNAEHLMNVANYCFLETVDPAHEKFHHDNTVDSVTRGRKGIRNGPKTT